MVTESKKVKSESNSTNNKQDNDSIDPFDPERLRLSPDFAESLGVKKALLTVPVRKPGRAWWVRVHPEESYQIQTAVIELKDEGEIYLIDPNLCQDLSSEVTFGPRIICTAVNRQGVVFLWPIKLPGPDGRSNDWNRTSCEAAERAKSKWVRVVANMDLRAYEVFEATATFPEPRWPEQSFNELLRIAFKEHFIKDLNHPVLRQLRGES